MKSLIIKCHKSSGIDGIGDLIIEISNEIDIISDEYIIFMISELEDKTTIYDVSRNIFNESKNIEIESNRIVLRNVDILQEILNISIHVDRYYKRINYNENIDIYIKCYNLYLSDPTGKIRMDDFSEYYYYKLDDTIRYNEYTKKYDDIVREYIEEGQRVISMREHLSPKMFLLNLYEDAYRDMKRDDKINFLNKYIDIFEGIEFDRLRELKSSIDEFKSKYTM